MLSQKFKRIKMAYRYFIFKVERSHLCQRWKFSKWYSPFAKLLWTTWLHANRHAAFVCYVWSACVDVTWHKGHASKRGWQITRILSRFDIFATRIRNEFTSHERNQTSAIYYLAYSRSTGRFPIDALFLRNIWIRTRNIFLWPVSWFLSWCLRRLFR